MAQNSISYDKTPLCVDLDGTLIKLDTLHQAILLLIRQKPSTLFLLPQWIRKGRAFTKNEVTRRQSLNVENLPYNNKLLSYIKSEKNKGKKIKVGKAPYIVDITLESSARFIKSKVNSKVTPVFSFNPSGIGGYRALPGGIFVIFSEDKTTEEIQDWYERRKLKYIEKLGVGKKAIWLIETLPGIKTFEIMNLIKNDSEIEFLAPNWWIQQFKK